MRNVKSEQLERLEQIEAQLKVLEEERSNIFERSFHGPESEKVCEDWIAEMMSEPQGDDATSRSVKRFVRGPRGAVVSPMGYPAGTLVAIRPCAKECENKTYLGVLLGDIATELNIRYHEGIEAVEVDFASHNPAIWVPDLERIVYGFESWWGPIKSEKELQQITDADINNIWYVKALKSISAKDEQA